MSHFSDRLAARTAQQIENAIHVHEYRHARLPRLGLPVGSGGTSTGTSTGSVSGSEAIPPPREEGGTGTGPNIASAKARRPRWQR